MLSAIIVIAGGILAAAPLIISKKPNAKELIDKMVPYQGWIGVVLFIWGIFDLLGSLSILGLNAVVGIVAIAVSAVELLVGFILGFGLISKYALSKNEAAKKKGDEILAKLIKFQIPLGIAAIVLGLIYLLFVLGIIRMY